MNEFLFFTTSHLFHLSKRLSSCAAGWLFPFMLNNMKLTYLQVENGQILAISYALTSHLSVNHQGWNTNQSERPTVCCFIKIQAPSGGRKQNCRFISVETTTDPNILFGFSTVLLYNMLFKGALQTREECLDWQLEQAQNKEHANVTIICSRSST